MIIWRIAGAALVIGLALFLISILVKLLLVAAGIFLLVRLAGGLFMSRLAGRHMPGGQSTIISIDKPAYQAVPTYRPAYDRIISIN